MAQQNSTFRRTRAEVHTRLVPYAPDGGEPRMVEQQYTVHVPVPPRDWDRIVLAGVTAATGAVVAGSVAWTTASVGDLLSTAVHPAIAYGVASIFDLAWISALAIEWLARYEPRKAALPRAAGYVALVIAMAAVFIHGLIASSLSVGIIGALVSALAKGMWTLALKHHAKTLDPLSQQWVDQQMSEAGARLAMAAVRRQLLRVDGQLADYAAVYIPADHPGPDPDKPSGQPDTVSATVRSAVRAAIATMPEARPNDIVEQLARIGIDTDADTVRTVSGQHPDTTDSTSAAVLQLAPHDPDEKITDTVRRVVRTTGQDLDAVLSAVRRVHGPDTKRDTVRRILDRVAG